MPKKKLPPGEPLVLALADLARSGLDDSDRELLGMIAKSAAETRALHASFKDLPALLIPYYDPWTGQPMVIHPGMPPYFRMRYLKNDTDLVAVATGKSQRYAQPPGTGLAAYFPPNVSDWPTILKDARYNLLLTEGEKKAACACKYGYYCIGLGGVWSFMSSKESHELLPELKAINWVKRHVYIGFDSDAKTKPDVCKAAITLAERLEEQGAYVHFIEMPEVVSGGKSGMDDVLVSMADKTDFAKYLHEAPELGATRGLWEMNDSLVYVRDINVVMERATNLKIKPDPFVKSTYANAVIFEQVINPDDGTIRLKKANAADRWMKFPFRADATSLTYVPGQPLGFINGSSFYNMWPGWGVEPRQGDASRFIQLVHRLFEGAPPGVEEYFWQWMAWPLQHPGDKMYVASAFYSLKHGLGKSLIAYTLGKIYGKNFTAIKERDLTASFNPWNDGCQFLLIDDVTGSDNRAHADLIKTIITQQDAIINIKFISQYTVKDVTNIMLTSNNSTAYYLDGDDRRFFVHEATCDPYDDPFYQGYDFDLHHDPEQRFAAAVFHHLLHNVDCSNFNPHARALLTQSKTNMIEEVKTDLASWCDRLANDPDHALLEGQPSLQKNGRVDGDLFTNEELRYYYDTDHHTRETANSVGRALTRAGIRKVANGQQIMTIKGQQRYYAVRNIEQWLKAKPDAIRKYVNTLYGGGK